MLKCFTLGKCLKLTIWSLQSVRHLTHYEILGVKPDASKDEIKKAYKKKSLELHPDVNQDDPKTHDKFVELKDAYGTLLKEDSREQYDKDLNMAFIYHRHKTRHRSLEDEHDLQHKNFERHFNVKIDKADFIKQVEEMEKESRSAAGPKIDRSVGKYIVAFYICAAVFAFFVVYSEMTKRKFSEIPQQKRYVHPSQMAMSHEKEAFMKHYKDQQDKELGHMYMMMRSKKIKETKEDNIKQAQFAEEKVRKNRRLRTGGSKKKEETAQ
ncbi:dnaJ homolog subfamily C member 21-like isoform X1 [Mytilus californianus]|uniref:dnaJ homolog subfamily C member 21-like isoform X1 n=1 Tax=Mytilus californianus TaxID=6549 RepID=UPI002247CFC5|nr:dnaJ homolog subfamily C member 21-like isoform X1 [Mytilus californianus]